MKTGTGAYHFSSLLDLGWKEAFLLCSICSFVFCVLACSSEPLHGGTLQELAGWCRRVRLACMCGVFRFFVSLE